MRMGRSGRVNFLCGVETSINVVKSFIFDTDIKNFLTIKNSVSVNRK